MEKSQATRLRHASAGPQTDDVSTLMQNKAIHCSRHRYRKKKKNASWPFYFGNNGPLCIFRTRIWLMKSANWPFFFLVVSDFIRFCQNEWIHCESSNVYNVDRAKVYNRQIWGGQLKQFDHCYRVHINGFHSFWRSWTWLTEWQDSFGYTLFKEDFEKAF